MKISKLLLASHNKNKLAELKNMLKPYQVEVVSAVELNLPDVEETGETFEDNARLKAETLAKMSGFYCLADDSGLCVNCLGGKPGVFSARYASNRDFDKGMDMLLAEIENSVSDDRSAYFCCVLALANPNGKTQFFEGRVNGKIARQKSGKGGFGYDPIFIPEGYDKSFAELGAEEKNRISHRGQALQKFVKACFG